MQYPADGVYKDRVVYPFAEPVWQQANPYAVVLKHRHEFNVFLCHGIRNLDAIAFLQVSEPHTMDIIWRGHHFPTRDTICRPVILRKILLHDIRDFGDEIVALRRDISGQIASRYAVYVA
jgi:hypothetical protein